MNLIEDIINQTIHIIQRSKPSQWSRQNLLDSLDYKTLEEEFGNMKGAESKFDPLKIRQRTWANWKEGRIECSVFECEYGRLVVFFPSETISEKDIPFSLWSHIMAAFAPPGKKIRIYFVASDSPRIIPETGLIGPEHINGGYCYPCQKIPCVFIFRAEDATRVLIHELLHAFCSDRFDIDLDTMEARTEIWAEIIWCCFLSGGNKGMANRFVERQTEWIFSQNRTVANYIGEQQVQARLFPWRYTIGKEIIIRRWRGQSLRKISKNIKNISGNSLRLTSPYVAHEGAKILNEPEKLI